MMGHAIIGCDVLPAAAHLTASMLSGAHPSITYDRSNILTAAYGKMPHGNIALAPLIYSTTRSTSRFLPSQPKWSAVWVEKEMETWSSLPHASFDFVVMNPPFVRPTDTRGKKIGVPVPMFAAFNSSEERAAVDVEGDEEPDRRHGVSRERG